MGNTRNTYRTVLNILGGTALLAGLAACAAGQPEATGSAAPTPSLAPSASASTTATPTPETGTDPVETAAWAAGVVPTGGSDGFILAQNGHFEAGTPGAFTVQLATLPPGGYSVYFACRGDSETTVTLAVAGDDAATLSGGCAGESTGMDVTTTADGVTFQVTGESGEAVDWALAVTDLLPRTEG
ncbi:hypothetical protein [Cryobacterium sp. AP23]